MMTICHGLIHFALIDGMILVGDGGIKIKVLLMSIRLHARFRAFIGLLPLADIYAALTMPPRRRIPRIFLRLKSHVCRRRLGLTMPRCRRVVLLVPVVHYS